MRMHARACEAKASLSSIEVDVWSSRQAGSFQGLLGGRNRAGAHHGWFDASDRRGDDSDQRFESKRLAFLPT